MSEASIVEVANAMVAELSQPGILAPCQPAGRSIAYRPAPSADPRLALARLRDGPDPQDGVPGGYYWCPPIAGGRLDLRLLGL